MYLRKHSTHNKGKHIVLTLLSLMGWFYTSAQNFTTNKDTLCTSTDFLELQIGGTLGTDPLSVFNYYKLNEDGISSPLALGSSSNAFDATNLIASGEKVFATIENGGTTTPTDTIAITILQASITQGDSLIACSSLDSVQLNSNTIIAASGNTYSWSSTDANINFNSTDVSSIKLDQQTMSRPDTSYITLQVDDNNGCITEDSIKIIWDEYIEVDLTDYFLFFCQGDSAQSKAFVNGSGEIVNYEWNILSGPADTVVTADTIITVRSAQNGILEVVGYNEIGCDFRDTLIAVETVLETELSTIDPISCRNQFIPFTVDFDSIPNTVYTYQWIVNGAPYSTSKDTTYFLTDSAIVDVVVTDNTLGCRFEQRTKVDLSEPVAVGSSRRLDTVRICEGDFITTIDASNSFSGTPFQVGIQPYSYLWRSDEVTFDLSDTTTIEVTVENIDQNDNFIGLVELEIADSLGCTAVDSIWLEWNNQFELSFELDSFLLCENGYDSIKVIDNGLGTFSNYQYSTSQGSTNYTVSADTALFFTLADSATIHVEAEDEFGCPAEDSVFVNDIKYEPIISELDSLYCIGETLNLSFDYDSVKNHTYSYQWFLNDLGVSTAKQTSFSINSNTEIKVALTDETLGCLAYDSVNTYISVPLAQAGLEDTVFACIDEFELAINANGSTSGTPFTSGDSYTYSWTSSEANFTLSETANDTLSLLNNGSLNNFIGAIQLEITDSLGCSDIDSVWVEWDATRMASLSPESILFCSDDTDTAYATVTNLIDPVNYSWSVSQGTTSFTAINDTSISITSAQDATILFSVTDNETGCLYSDSLSAGDVFVNASIDSLPDTLACLNEIISLTVSLDSVSGHDYQFEWSDGSSIFSTQDSTSYLFSEAKTITVTVTDLTLGCTDQDAIQITINEPIAQAGLEDTLSFCRNILSDTVNANASFGGVTYSSSSPYKYSWTSSYSNVGISQSDSSVAIISNINSLNNFVGAVQLEITDSVGCTSIDSIWFEWDNVNDIVLAEDSLLFCAGQTSNTTINTIGAGPFNDYTWTTLFGNAAQFSNPSQNEIEVQFADSAFIQVSAVDDIGCYYYDTLFVDVDTINVAIASPKLKACIGDVLTLAPNYENNSLGRYTFEWTIDSDLYSSMEDTIYNFTDTIKVELSVENEIYGCVETDSITVFPSIPEAGISLEDSLEICFGIDSLSISANGSFGGTLPFDFEWMTSDTLAEILNDTLENTFIVKQAESSNFNTWVNLSLTDSVGCSSQDSVFIHWQKEITANVSTSSLVCNTLNDTLVSIPNFENIEFEWTALSSASILSDVNSDTLVYNGNSSTDDAAFNLSLTNELGCEKDTTIAIGLQNLSLGITAPFDTLCPGSELTFVATAEEASSDLIYSWDGASFLINDTTRTFSFETDSTITVSAIDPSTNCPATGSMDLTVELLTVAANLESDSICFGDSALLQVNETSGGTGVYTTSWSGGEFTEQQEEVYANPSTTGLQNSTAYIVTVEDELGCVAHDSVFIYQNNEITSILNLTYSVCQDSTLFLGDTSGTANGGSGNLEITWSITSPAALSATTGDTTTVDLKTTPLTAVLDFNVVDTALPSCTYSSSILVSLASRPELSLDSVVTICPNSSVVLDANPTNSTGNSYEWYPNLETTDSIIVSDSIAYIVEVTSSFGCVNYDTTTVRFSDDLVASVSGDSSDFCLYENRTLYVTTDSLNSVVWNFTNATGDSLTDTSYVVSALESSDSVLVEITISNECKDTTLNVNMTALATPEAAISTSQVEFATFQDIQFINETSTAHSASYQWEIEATQETIESTDSIGPVVVYEDLGEYNAQLSVIDDSTSCVDTTQLVIQIEIGENVIYVPNVLYPTSINQDNSVIKVYGETISSDNFEFNIYNRWGQIVYSTMDVEEAQTNGWDGTDHNSKEDENVTAYTYILKGQFIDGSTFEESGSISLIR